MAFSTSPPDYPNIKVPDPPPPRDSRHTKEQQAAHTTSGGRCAPIQLRQTSGSGVGVALANAMAPTRCDGHDESRSQEVGKFSTCLLKRPRRAALLMKWRDCDTESKYFWLKVWIADHVGESSAAASRADHTV